MTLHKVFSTTSIRCLILEKWDDSRWFIRDSAQGHASLLSGKTRQGDKLSSAEGLCGKGLIEHLSVLGICRRYLNLPGGPAQLLWAMSHECGEDVSREELEEMCAGGQVGM